MDAANQKVLVTGATGFIGAHVTRRLLSDKLAPVRALARDPGKAQALAQLGAEVVRGDLRDFASLQRAVEGCSVVIHAAAQVSSVPGRRKFEQANVWGTENALRASAAAGVRRFVPAFSKKGVRHDSLSTAGVRQSVLERIDNFPHFTLEWLRAGSQAAAWAAFADCSLAGGPFDYYPARDLPYYVTYLLDSDEFEAAYKVVGRYTLSPRFRLRIA